MIRALLRDGLVYAIPMIVSRGLSLFLVPLYTRVLSPADYGSLDLLMVFGTLVTITLSMEVTQGVARFYTDEADPERKADYASSALWFTVVGYLVFGALALAASPQLSSWILGREDLVDSFRLGVLYIVANGVFYYVQNQFRFELRSRHYAATSLIQTLTTSGCAVCFAYVLEWGLPGLLLGMALGTTAGDLCGLWWLRGTFRLRLRGRLLKELLAFSAPLVPSGVAVFVSAYVDRVMINHYLSIEDVGLYGIGFRLSSVVGLVLAGFQGALTPLIYTHHRDPKTPQDLARIFRLFVGFALVLFLALSVFAREALVLLTTPAYYEAHEVVIFLVPAILFSQMYVFAPGPTIAKKTYLFLWINLFGATLNTLLNALLIPHLGILGAALATFLGYLCVFLCYLNASQRLYPVPHRYGPILSAVGLVGGWAALLCWLDLGLAARVAACLPALFVAPLTGLIPVSDLRQAWDALRRGKTPGSPPPTSPPPESS